MNTGKSYRTVCITNRHLAEGHFMQQIRTILALPPALMRPDAMILREKDLPPDEYLALMREVKPLCERAGVKFIAHCFISEALLAGADAVHLPLPVFLEMTDEQKRRFREIGVSVHSLSQARQAWLGGASYITASHIFPTQCKPGLPPRGLDFLSEICAESPIPVYALGGVHPSNISDCIHAGAAGVCMMSEYMRASSQSR